MSELRVGVELGATVNTGDYNSIKPVISISGIDPSGDVEAQVQLALGAAVKALTPMDEELETVVVNLISSQSNQKGYADRVKKIEHNQRAVAANVETVFAKVKELIQKVDDMAKAGDADAS